LNCADTTVSGIAAASFGLSGRELPASRASVNDGENIVGLSRADWDSVCEGFSADKVKTINPKASDFISL